MVDASSMSSPRSSALIATSMKVGGVFSLQGQPSELFRLKRQVGRTNQDAPATHTLETRCPQGLSVRALPSATYETKLNRSRAR